MKATFAMFDFGFKNLLKIERPTSENIIFRNQNKNVPSQESQKIIALCFTYKNKYIKKITAFPPKEE